MPQEPSKSSNKKKVKGFEDKIVRQEKENKLKHKELKCYSIIILRFNRFEGQKGEWIRTYKTKTR